MNKLNQLIDKFAKYGELHDDSVVTVKRGKKK